MKVLLVSVRFAPYDTIGARTVGSLAQMLESLGHDVRVVTCHPQPFRDDLELPVPRDQIVSAKWLLGRFDAASPVSPRSDTRAEAGDPGPLTSLIRSMSQMVRSFLIPDPYVVWVPFALLRTRKLVRGSWTADLVLSSGPPHSAHVAGFLAAKVLSAPHVMQFRDLWAENPYDVRSGASRVASAMLERFLVRAAGGLVFSSEAALNRTTANLRSMRSIVFRPWQRVDSSPFATGVDRPLGPEVESDRRIEVVHAGSLIAGKRDPSALLHLIGNDDDLRSKVRVSFYGPESAWITELVELAGYGDFVNVAGNVPHAEAESALACADVLLLLTWASAVDDHTIPGKLYEYLRIQKPVAYIGRSSDEIDLLVRHAPLSVSNPSGEEFEDFLRSVRDNQWARDPVPIDNEIEDQKRDFDDFLDAVLSRDEAVRAPGVSRRARLRARVARSSRIRRTVGGS